MVQRFTTGGEFPFQGQRDGGVTNGGLTTGGFTTGGITRGMGRTGIGTVRRCPKAAGAAESPSNTITSGPALILVITHLLAGRSGPPGPARRTLRRLLTQVPSMENGDAAPTALRAPGALGFALGLWGGDCSGAR